MQQLLAAIVLWLRTRWLYDREAAHLQEVAETIIEDSSDTGSSGRGRGAPLLPPLTVVRPLRFPQS